MHWHTTRFRVDLSQPRVMGIVNLTPDSFSDGGRLADTRTALAHAQRLLREGADLLDLGAESSRPGAPPVSAVEEWCRLEPVLREALHWGVPLSVDTCKVEVMRRALDLGVDVINDIQALRAPGAEELLARCSPIGVSPVVATTIDRAVFGGGGRRRGRRRVWREGGEGGGTLRC